MRNAGPVSPPDPPGSRTEVGSKRLAGPEGRRASRTRGPALPVPSSCRPAAGATDPPRAEEREEGCLVGREPPHAPAREIVERAPVPPLLDHGGAHVGRAGDRRGVAELLSDTAHHGGEDPPLVGRRLGKPAVGKAARCRERAAPGAEVLRRESLPEVLADVLVEQGCGQVRGRSRRDRIAADARRRRSAGARARRRRCRDRRPSFAPRPGASPESGSRPGDREPSRGAWTGW